MARTRVLITVKTYPAISTKYEELVCTAGFREDGTWIRIYPIQFRKRSYNEQYKKYDWIELDLVKNDSDVRPESFRPSSIDDDIKIVRHVGTKNNWAERKNIVLKKVYDNLMALITEAYNQKICTSLAVFKPKEILDFKITPVNRNWNKKKLESLRQMNLFERTSTSGGHEVVRKLPYKFSYQFEDEQGQKSTLMIEDWEIGQLYWKCLENNNGDEEKACQAVKKKYFDEFIKEHDIYLFLGTTKEWHNRRSKNPFIIIGVFYPKKSPDTQLSLFESD